MINDDTMVDRKDKFWRKLFTVIDNVCKHWVLILMGNLNGRVRKNNKEYVEVNMEKTI